MTRQRIRRGVFRSIAAINVYLAEHNASPKPFVWTKSAETILAKLLPLPCTIRLIQCTSVHAGVQDCGAVMGGIRNSPGR
jgi:hypothetical protein